MFDYFPRSLQHGCETRHRDIAVQSVQVHPRRERVQVRQGDSGEQNIFVRLAEKAS